MDLFCVGMYRACSTWQYDVAALLLERHRSGQRLGYLTGTEYADLDDREPAGDAWRVVKSHEGHPRFAQALAEGRALAIYSYRDLRDVVYSMLHKRGVSFAEFTRQGMVHQVLANDRFWNQQPLLLVQRYEDLIAQPSAGVAQLARHLGITLAKGEADEVAAEYSLQANRRRAAELGRRLQAEGIDVTNPANAQRYDNHTLLHWNHVRDGRAGGWGAQATPHQRAVLSRLVSLWLVAHGYELDRSWAASSGQSAEPSAPRAALARLRWEYNLALGWLRCLGRCASLRHPRLATALKRALGLPTEAVGALPAIPQAPGSHVRFDGSTSHANPAHEPLETTTARHSH
ncbi:MAG: sulfotransferase domain-containing protein [Isosphaeraceae bacterium]